MPHFKKNTAQETAIQTLNGPVILIACPGSGKTTTLIRRIHNMLEHGIYGENILMLTFSRNSAEDMRKRYIDSFQTTNGVTFRTYHALCLAILREEGLYDTADVIEENAGYHQVYKRLSDWHHLQDAADLAKNVRNEISLVKNSRADIRKYQPVSCEKKIFQDVFQDYQKMLENMHKIDYDDMLLYTERFLREHPAELEKWQDRFQYIQCDEYQDTNIIQRDIVYLLAGKYQNICVVGDDDQSIYAFRGAVPQVMFDFEKDFPKVKVIPMSTNYRSAENIVSMADTLIRKNQKRFDKNFVSYRGATGVQGTVNFQQFTGRADEIDYVIEKIQEYHDQGIPYKEMAVIFRNNNLAGMPMMRMADENIPFKTNETLKSIYDSWIFRSLCAYVYLSSGKWKKEYIDTVISMPYKYLRQEAFRDCAYNLEDMLQRLDYISEPWRHRQARGEIINIFSAFGPGMVTLEDSPAKAIKAMEFIGYRDAIAKRAKSAKEDEDEALMMLERMENDASKFSTIREWFYYAQKDRLRVKEINEQKNREDGVELVTMHGSKGCEWKVVFVIDVTNKTIPHRDAETQEQIEEERRLLYVALTRSKDILEITCLNPMSPFLSELLHSINQKKAKESHIAKPVAGEMIRHKKYGIGVVEGFKGEYIFTASFAGESKTFQFPQAFEDGFVERI